MFIVEAYDRLPVAQRKPLDEERFNSAIDYREKFASDKEWYKAEVESFKKAINTNQDSHAWLTQELGKFGIFQASEFFQKSYADQPHCMSFVYEFFHEQDEVEEHIIAHASFCDFIRNVGERIDDFVTGSSIKDIKEMKAGDTIVYENDAGFSHIALSLGKIDGKDFAASKFGVGYPVYIHALESVSDGYGVPVCFDTQSKLDKNANAKLEKIKQEAQVKIKPEMKSSTVLFASDKVERKSPKASVSISSKQDEPSPSTLKPDGSKS